MLDEIQTYIKENELPKTLKLNEFTTIVDVKKAMESHVEMSKIKGATFNPYRKRLCDMYKHIKYYKVN